MRLYDITRMPTPISPKRRSSILVSGLNCSKYLYAPWQVADVTWRARMAATEMSSAERAAAAIVLEFMLAKGAVAAAEALDVAVSAASTDSEQDTKAFEALQTSLCAEDSRSDAAATVLGTMCERVLARTATAGAKATPATEETRNRPHCGAVR
jgi:hypothetical protein